MSEEYKPLITIDMDDVLCPVTEAFVPWHNEKYGTTLLFEDILADNLHELLGLTKGEEFDRWLEFFADPLYMQTAPDPVAPMVLERIKDNFDVVIVSARNPKFQACAKPWLDKYFDGLYKDVVFIKSKDGGKRKKGEVCKELGSILHIDDEPRHYDGCKQNGIKFIYYTAPWNVDEKAEGRIDSFTDIYKYLPL